MISPKSNSQNTHLSDVSPRDKAWDGHRECADLVENHYSGSKFQKYSERISFCSQLLEFGFCNDDDGESLKLKLRSSKFCRVRHCPVCQWRRSLMWKSKTIKILPKVVADYPTHRWLFVTLTQKNVLITDLRDTLSGMNNGFKRMTDRKAFPAVGWLRSTEVTRGKDGSAHPHFHCLMQVPAGYFRHGYLTQLEWVELWRKSMRLDYDPVVDVRAVAKGKDPLVLIPEILKYVTKESDMVADRQWFLELTEQLHKTRAIATGGILKKYLRELEEEPEDLIGVGDDEEIEELGRLMFGWRRDAKKYKLVN